MTPNTQAGQVPPGASKDGEADPPGDWTAERERLTAFGSAVGVALTSGLAVPQMLGRCAEAMVEHLGAALARIWTVSADGAVLELHASAGMYTHLNGPHGRVKIGELKIGHIAASGEPHLTNALQSDPSVSDPDWVRREGLVGFAGYPLFVDGRLVGVMAMFAREPLPESTLSALGMVAQQFALGVDRLRVGQALLESEVRGAVVLDATGIGLWERRLDTGRTYWSPSHRALLGVGADVEASLDELFARVHPDDRKALAEQISVAIETRSEHEIEFRVIRPDGRTVWIAGKARLVEAGGVRRFVGVTADISERKRLQDELHRAQTMEAVGRLAGGIAHDFNNLLTIVLGYSELLTEALEPGSGPMADLREIQQAAGRARDLTAQLLAFGRRQLLQARTLDLNRIVAGATGRLREVVGQGVRVVTRLDPEAAPILADPAQLERILTNLAANAGDAMPHDGTLTLETRNIHADDPRLGGVVPAGEYVALVVTDTGAGMDAATQAHLFEPFFTTREGAAGLGLATVYGIVKQSGGYVTVRSAPGQGSSFRIYFPRVEAAATDSRPREKAPRGGGWREPGGHVLVVDDTEAVRKLARTLLEQDGYDVLEAADAAEARQVAAGSFRIDLLLTDLVMPGGSGAGLYAELARSRPGLRVIYMSGYTDDAAARDRIAAGAALAATVREVLDA